MGSWSGGRLVISTVFITVTCWLEQFDGAFLVLSLIQVHVNQRFRHTL